jgi:hypothetical protein
MNGDLRVEIVIRNKANTVDWNKYGISEMPSKWVLMETNYKLSINVPLDWKGFRDGTLHSMLEDFGDLVYVALAYYTDSSEVVLDGNGDKFDPYDAMVDGKCVLKYVKKHIRIVTIIDQYKKAYEVHEYKIDLSSSQPVMKVLEFYCVATETKYVDNLQIIREDETFFDRLT